MDLFLHYLTFPYLWEGAVIAVQLLVGALAGGIVIGFFLSLASLSKHWWLRLPVKTYIYLLRGTPVLLQLIILYNVLPQFGIMLSPFLSALLALTINETAYCAEIIRGGIISANRDQRRRGAGLRLQPHAGDDPRCDPAGAAGDPADARQRKRRAAEIHLAGLGGRRGRADHARPDHRVAELPVPAGAAGLGGNLRDHVLGAGTGAMVA